MNITQKSLDLLLAITDKINNQTFHHHYHILYDIANTFEGEINYVEIGCYAGGSACLMLQRPNTNVVSIDIGKPIPKTVVINNINKLNKHDNKYCYLEGNSQSDQMFQRLYKIIKTIDILFIDGDHTYHGVRNDFHLYEKLLTIGSYIVFDDYYDSNCPGVKKAVDELVVENTNYEIIGTLENTFNARGFPKDFTKNNCFIMRKEYSLK
jgi:cephalosporin hydroxylase